MRWISSNVIWWKFIPSFPACPSIVQEVQQHSLLLHVLLLPPTTIWMRSLLGQQQVNHTFLHMQFINNVWIDSRKKKRKEILTRVQSLPREEIQSVRGNTVSSSNYCVFNKGMRFTREYIINWIERRRKVGKSNTPGSRIHSFYRSSRRERGRRVGRPSWGRTEKEKRLVLLCCMNVCLQILKRYR